MASVRFPEKLLGDLDPEVREMVDLAPSARAAAASTHDGGVTR